MPWHVLLWMEYKKKEKGRSESLIKKSLESKDTDNWNTDHVSDFSAVPNTFDQKDK